MSDPNPPISPDSAAEERLGFVHENLEGWIPALATVSEIHEALEKAFDYRGDLTITLKNGQKVEGYVFDRQIKGPALSDCFIRVMPKDQPGKLSIPYSDIAGLAFTGRDTAAGKSFAAWVKKYNEKKAAGEKNIGIDAEPLDE
jgi:hypothetical protein